MLQGNVKELLDMLVIQGVIDHGAFFAGLHQTGKTKDLQLMRNSGLPHPSQSSKICHAKLLFGEVIQYGEPRGITKNLKEFCQSCDDALLWQCSFYLFYLLCGDELTQTSISHDI